MPEQNSLGLNRRDLMGAVAVGAAGMGFSDPAHAQDKSAEAGPLKVIDFHNHYIGPSFAITANASTPAQQLVNSNLANPAALLGSLDVAGVAGRVIKRQSPSAINSSIARFSPGSPGVSP